MNILLLCLSLLVVATGVFGQSSVDTSINFNFKNLVTKVGSIVNAPPRNTTRSLFNAVGLFDVRGKNVASSPDQVQGAQVAFAELNRVAVQMQTGNVFRLDIQDTLAVPQNCLDIVKASFARGIRVFIGPSTSAELRAVQNFANENGLVFISPSSTAADLSVIDNVFRVTVSDSSAAAALARYIVRGGYTRVIVAYRNDLFGQGYMNVLSQQLLMLGASQPILIPYQDTTPLATVASSISASAGNVSAINANTAVVLVSFDEWTEIVSVASNNAALNNVLWIGPEMTSTKVPASIGAYARSTRVVSVSFFVGDENTVQIKVRADLVARGVGFSSEAFLGYDAALLAGIAFVAERREDSPIYRSSLIAASNMLYGASGRLELNAVGDRALGQISFHSLRSSDVWTLNAVYDPASSSFLQI